MHEESGQTRRIEEIFDGALSLHGDEREAFLARACSGDSVLREEVEDLLQANREADEGALLETDALGLVNDGAIREVAERIEVEHLEKRSREEAAGQWIGPYRLLQRIGEGGFGVVWMAEQRQPLRRRVALKIVKLGMDTKQVVARFEQERQALAMMDHPNIARVLDAGATPQGRPYFAMDLVRGQKITDFCDEENLSTTERLKLFTSVCAAVQHAHQKGIIHRDLKPSNILVTLQDGEPIAKVIDFGVAKATQHEQLTELTLFTQFEQMIGTPMYMAPEQAELSSVDIDTRCDIYALGVLLYELVAGRPPFDPETLLRVGIDEVRRLIRETEPPKPSTRLSTLDGESRSIVAKRRRVDEQRLLKAIRGDLDWIVMKAMEKSRHRRYDTANELADDVRRHLEGDPVLARPPSRVYRLRRMARKHRIAWGTGAAVLLVMIASVAGVAWQGAQAQREAESARETLALLRAGAAGYATEAETLINRGAVEQAVAKLDLAIGLDPDRFEYRLVKADILQASLRFAEAAEDYRKVLGKVPHHPRASSNLALCEAFLERREDGKDLSREELRALLQAMSREHRPAGQIAQVRKRLQRETEPLWQAWLQRLVETLPPIEEGRLLEERLSTTDDFGLALDLSRVALAELSFPAGIPLERLDLSHTPVSDLSPLQGLPLRHLDLRGCTAAAGYAVLAELSELETLRLHDGLVGFDDKEIEALGALRGHAKLKQIESVGSESPDDFEEASAFWARYDLNQKATEALHAFVGVTGENRRYGRRPNWNWVVLCAGFPIKDLEAIRGLPIERLDLMETSVRDLSPLEGMPLKWLRLIKTDVTDLTPLAKLPLLFLHLEDCAPRIDVTPLSRIPTLEDLFLPPKPVGLNALRGLPKLDRVSYQGIEVDDKWAERRPLDFWANTQPVNEGLLVRVGRFNEAEAIIRDRRLKHQLVRDMVKLGVVQLAQGDVEDYHSTCEALVDLTDESKQDERLSNRRRRSDVLAETVARLCLLSPTLPVSNTDLEGLLRMALPLAENPVRGCFYYLTAGLHAYRRGDYGGALRSFRRVRTEHYDGVILAARAGSVMAHWNLGEEKEASALLEGLEDAVMAAWNEVPDHSQYWLEYAYAWLLAGEVAALVAGPSPIPEDGALGSAAGGMPGRTSTVDVEESRHDDSQEE